MNEKNQIKTDAAVSLREISKETVRKICNLKVSDDQNKFVAPNAVSIAEAYFYEEAWFRAIYADNTPMGFLMLYDDRKKPEYFLWRMMIDTRFQGMGFGKKAMSLLIDHVKSLPNAAELLTSCVPGDGSPEEFYLNLGFILTGDIEDGEVVMRLELT